MQLIPARQMPHSEVRFCAILYFFVTEFR